MGAQGGCVLLSVSDADYTVTRSLIYDASGLLYDSDGKLSEETKKKILRLTGFADWQ